jgi:DevC protein
MFLRRLPLAWLQLTHQKSRLLTAVAGVAFAAVLMFVQIGFKDALYESATLLQQKFRGDLMMLSDLSATIFVTKPVPRRLLYQAMNHRGVASITPIYLAYAPWKNPWTHGERSILIIAFETQEPMLDLPGVAENLARVEEADAVLFDRLSRPEFGEVGVKWEQGEEVSAEVNRHRLKVKGLFSFGATFSSDGMLITSEQNFRRIFPGDTLRAASIGLITLTPGADLDRVKDELTHFLPSSVKVVTRAEFIAAEKYHWETSTAIGFIFNLGVIMGFSVGAIIAYQILHSDVVNHLDEYATLKAIGFSDWYLVRVIFYESIILSVLGYLPGILLSWWLFGFAARATSLPMKLAPGRAVEVLVLTNLMCFVSGLIAIRKLRKADPADIF